MTEYDDALIDMSDVDDKLDDETETSSSEIDERGPSTSDSRPSDQNNSHKTTRRLSDSINNNNHILVLSSNYYVQSSPESPREDATQDTTLPEDSQTVPEGNEHREDDSVIGNTIPDSFVPLLESTLVADDTSSSQLLPGELGDSEEDKESIYLTPNSSELRDAEDCDIIAELSLLGDLELITETETGSEGCVPVATASAAEGESHQGQSNPTDTCDQSDKIPGLSEIRADEEKDSNSKVIQDDCYFTTDLSYGPEPNASPSEIPVRSEAGSEEAEQSLEFSQNFVETPEESEAPLSAETEGEESRVQEIRAGDCTVVEQRFPALEAESDQPCPTTTTTSTTHNPTPEAVFAADSVDTSPIHTSVSTADNIPQSEAAVEVTMGENARVQEKLRQFEDNKKGKSEDTKGTFTGSNSNLSEIEKQRRRNLIFDEERFEETFLKCLICREVYNDTDKLPKMLHCHHTFCMDCLYQMYRVEGEFRQSLTGVFRHGMPMTVKIQCPTCREGIIISESELRRLPNDHTIMELLCFVNQTGKNEVQYCTKHQMQPLNFFCEPCIMPVCCDCTVIDHKESKGHIVVNVDEAMEKYTPIVEQTLTDIRQEKTNIVDKRAALEAAQDDLDRIQKDLTRQVRSVFDSIREILDEREKELYDASEAEIERKREVLEGHIKTLGERDTMLNTEFNELQKAKDDKDISLIFTGHKSARDALAKKVYVPTNSTKGFSVTFQFSSRADSVIKQNVANLGDIIFQS